MGEAQIVGAALVAGVTGLIAVRAVGKSYLPWRDQQRQGASNPVA
jgi:hypothetical protein